VTVGTSGAVFGLYGLLIALLIWQTFHEWRGTWRTSVDAEAGVSLAKAEAAPYLQNTLLQHLDRPPMNGWSTAAAGPAGDLRQDHGGTPKLQVAAEDGLPPLDPSWGLDPETPAPAAETWSPAVAAPVVEAWHPAVEASGAAIAPWDPAPETWGSATETWSAAAETLDPDPVEPTTAVPLVAMKRIGVVAAVFLLYSMFAGFAGCAGIHRPARRPPVRSGSGAARRRTGTDAPPDRIRQRGGRGRGAGLRDHAEEYRGRQAGNRARARD
jgi:hypothetical protein